MNDNSLNAQLNELVSFIQHDIPGLEDGKYRLQVTQQVKDANNKVVSDDSLTTTNTFAVTGDRFSLKKPAELIYSLFPADGATGRFDTVFPSVVLTKTTFPWSRYPVKSLNEEYTNISPGQDTDADVSTWLYVLLLDEEDVTGYQTKFPDFTVQPSVVTIGDLFSSAANPQSTLKDNYSYFYGVTNQNKPLENYMDLGDQPADKVQVLDIPISLFWKIAPTINDLKLMAHVRKVSLLNKPTMPGISDVGEPEGSFSIVFGNRLPGPARKNYAYLVSLEEMEEFLPASEDGGAPVNSRSFIPDATKMLRLAVLTSWTFYSTGNNTMFVDQLNALNNAARQLNKNVNADTSANTNLRLTAPAGALPIVQNALSMGYVPLNHQLRAGEITRNGVNINKTVSWYRGPLVTYPISQPSVHFPVASPDQATIFDPTTGMLDTSYAAAWTLGRQMALQDKGFSTTLYNWKKGLTRDVVNNIENQLLSQSFSAVFAPVNMQTANIQQAAPASLLQANPAEQPSSPENVLRLEQQPVAGNLLLKTILSLHSEKQTR